MIGETLEQVISRMKLKAATGQYYYGREPPEHLQQYSDDVAVGELTIHLILTRDIGHHTGGWFKNPDYERCWHLSISYRGSDGHPMAPGRRLEKAPQMHKISDRICRMVYGDDVRLCWAEPPFSKVGKEYQVWHYRVFCDEAWRPFMPRGEVYTREFTEKGWKSFSDLHGYKPLTATTID